ncbi:putative serine/threonine-kinase pknA domain protein [Mycobacterium kansasii 824]|nr:putative serine/threonine-kinase pknA domain protein [Mycobacterium kansasii 824]
MGVVGYEAVSGKRPFTGDGALTVAMKHIKEPPPPLPAELPPNVRELIEITLVKNPQMRYRSGGPFADAVAAVRAGRRPPRPSQSPPPGRAAPAAIPSSAPARIAGNPTSRATAPRRSRPATGGNRPPARRTFSSASGRCCGLPASSGRWPSSSRCSSSSIRVATTSRSYRPRP